MIASDGRAGGRRVVLHLGMLKTGSTSIQEVWNGYKDERIEYAPLGLPNHSMVLQRAFLEGKTADRVFRNADRASRPRLREAALKQLGKVLDGTPRSIILSGETLSRLDLDSAQRCVEFLRRHVDRIDALLYVRAPESFARSVFQQRLKRGEASFNLRSIVPHYRAQLLTWTKVLGEEPTCVLFDRSTLLDGDVVADFGARLGLDPAWARARAHLQNRNISLSAEAMAALYLLRHQRGAPATHQVESVRQKRFIEVLGGYGTHRYDFGRDLMDAALAERAEEIAWIEERLGRPFPKETVKDPVVFASERAILDYGEAQAAPLREHLRERGIIGAGVNGSTVELLEAMQSRAIGPLGVRAQVELRKGRLGTILRRLAGQFARVRG